MPSAWLRRESSVAEYVALPRTASPQESGYAKKGVALLLGLSCWGLLFVWHAILGLAIHLARPMFWHSRLCSPLRGFAMGLHQVVASLSAQFSQERGFTMCMTPPREWLHRVRCIAERTWCPKYAVHQEVFLGVLLQGSAVEMGHRWLRGSAERADSSSAAPPSAVSPWTALCSKAPL